MCIRDRGKEDPYESTISFNGQSWSYQVTPAQLKDFLAGRGYSCAAIVDFAVTETTANGNVNEITITDSNGKTFVFKRDDVRILQNLPGVTYMSCLLYTSQRMEKGLSFLEFNYMIMQSYDFYHLFQPYGCNMQFGGNDQWSNMLGGTELIRRKLGKDAHAMTITLLLNSEGKKMGKTAKGAVWLDPNKTSPFEFYQYW